MVVCSIGMVVQSSPGVDTCNWCGTWSGIVARGWFIGVRPGTVPQQKERNSPLVHILEVVECSLAK